MRIGGEKRRKRRKKETSVAKQNGQTAIINLARSEKKPEAV